MIPEIKIKISFAAVPSGVIEPTVTVLEISPPELSEETSVAAVPPPPEVHEDSSSSFPYEVPPPPATMTGEDDLPPIPGTGSAENAFEEIIKPPPAPVKGNRSSKTK